MKTYKQHLKEKISYNDLSGIENDPNFVVGIEFEFVLDSEYLQREPEIGSDDYQSYYDDYVNGWVDFAETINSEYESLEAKLTEIKDNIFDSLENKINEIQDKIDGIEAQEDIFEKSKIEALEDEIIKLDGYKDRLEDFVSEKKVFEDIYEYISKKDFVSTNDLVILRDYYNSSSETILDYVLEEQNSKTPTMDDTLYDFYYYRIDIGRSMFDDLESKLIEYIVYDGGYSDNSSSIRSKVVKIMHSLEFYDGFEDIDMGEEAEYDLTDITIWEDLPFNDYDVSNVPKTPNDYTRWRVEPDTSVGTEIISKKLTLKEALGFIPKVFDFIKQYGTTTDDAGFHVNISYKGKDIIDLDLLKMSLFMEEEFVWKFFPSREDNPYTKSVKNVIKTERFNSSDKKFFSELGKNIMNMSNKVSQNIPDRYFGINVVDSYEEDEKRVEFRYLGGSGYTGKYNKIREMLLKYCYILKLGWDEKLRKEEYFKKLYRLLEKTGAYKDIDLKYVMDNILKYDVNDRGYVYSLSSPSPVAEKLNMFDKTTLSEFEKVGFYPCVLTGLHARSKNWPYYFMSIVDVIDEISGDYRIIRKIKSIYDEEVLSLDKNTLFKKFKSSEAHYHIKESMKILDELQ